jgi:hypothetical protein
MMLQAPLIPFSVKFPLYALFLGFLAAVPAHAGAIAKWSGLRNPCKVSAGDGVVKLDAKIGKFMELSYEEWRRAIFNVNRRFPGSRPWVTLAVGELPEKSAVALTPEQDEEFLARMDQLGVDVFLEVWPGKSDVPAAIDHWLGKFKPHRSVRGFGVDLEYYRPVVDDATAKAWDEKIKRHDPSYRLFLKHWRADHMPPTYRGNGDVIFICTSSEASVEFLTAEFAKWADHFAPSACAFQFGYPADEDGMDGKNTTGWWTLKDPIKDWGAAILSRIADPKQEIGLLWVCVKSGKSYNADWDLTEKKP